MANEYLGRVRRAGLLILLLISSIPARASGVSTGQLADLELEQLLGLEVYAASRFPQPLAEAPSAITVITGEDIRQYGYRTLADVLRSIPGLHLSSDHVYEYLGVRGIRRAGDYNAPVLLLIDGRRQNDNVYEAAAIGRELPVPIELIDRVEFVRGPGSSVFGSNALFGTINVVTRAPAAQAGLRLLTEVGSAGLRRGYLQYDRPLAAETRLQLSAAYGQSKGEDLLLPGLAASPDGQGNFRDIDGELFQQYSARLASGPWMLQAMHGERLKQSPLPIYGADPGDPGNRYRDRQGFLGLNYEGGLGRDWLLRAQMFGGYYGFRGDLVYEGVLNRDRAEGRWWGGELNAVYGGISGHRLLIGIDLQRDQRQQQTNYDVDPYLLYQDTRQRGLRVGVYVQDDWRFSQRLSLDLGLRHDSYSDFDAVTTPRAALILKPWSRQTVKLIYGRAYRVPSSFERYYEVEGYEANPDLVPEVASNWDLIWENRVSDSLRVQAAAQYLRVHDFIVQSSDPASPQFTNRERAEAQGLDLMLDKHWFGGARSRASLSLQRADDETGDFEDAPRWLAKLHNSLPLVAGSRLGLELLGTGERRTALGTSAGYWLLNLTISGVSLRPGLSLSASVDNLFDDRYTDPSSPDLAAVGIDAVPGGGRQFRLRLEAEF
jgi:iron complex outermembrane receptor protein